jgi:ubiquinone/menaquinone biosynthesis C-methylase UbiE
MTCRIDHRDRTAIEADRGDIMPIQAEELYDLIYSFKDYAKEASIIQGFIHERLPQAKTILDVACGTGKHIQYLNQSFKVDGIDINERYIEIARQRNPSSTFWWL